MAKTQTLSSSFPVEQLAVSQAVLEEDAQLVSEELNWSFGYGLAVQSEATILGDAGWGATGNEIEAAYAGPGLGGVRFNTASGYSRRFRKQVRINPDTTQLEIRTTVTMPAANTGRVRTTIGATNTVHSHTAGATTTITSTLNVSATGSGLVTLEIELDHQTGSSDACILESFGWRQVERTSGLPDPSG